MKLERSGLVNSFCLVYKAYWQISYACGRQVLVTEDIIIDKYTSLCCLDCLDNITT